MFRQSLTPLARYMYVWNYRNIDTIRKIFTGLVLHDHTDPPTVGVARIAATVIARVVDAGFVLALAFNASNSAAERRLGAVADVGLQGGQARWSAALAKGAGFFGVV